MACDCNTVTCVEARFNPCSDGVMLDIVATETSVWSGEIEFNGVWTRFGFGVEEDDNIIIPTQFLNENYDHSFKLYDATNTLVGCYSIKARAMGNAGDYAPVAPIALTYIDYEVTDSGNTISADFLLNKKLVLISMDGQAYNSAFWSKPIGSDTITSSILTFIQGQTITFILR